MEHGGDQNTKNDHESADKEKKNISKKNILDAAFLFSIKKHTLTAHEYCN